MPLVGFEHIIPVLERAKTFHTLDRAANEIILIQHKGLMYSQEVTWFARAVVPSQYLT
jgi:hypothetical protein